ncbi:MAG TPA: acyltransferase [Pseudonocardia sp.]|nr:acyltransferase [Pseudonocardia sp.]
MTYETSVRRERAVSVAGGQVGASREWLGQLDVLRLLGCLSVITIHCLGAPFDSQTVTVGWITLLLHYSREVFLFTSALVLARAYYPQLTGAGRLADESGFRWRRLRQIGVPYLCWTTAYLLLALVHEPGASFSATVRDLPLRWATLVATGTGWYHLYFLLVSLQFGLVFPLVLRLLRRTEGRHGRVLVVSFVLQAVTLYGYQRWGLPGTGWRALFGDASLPAYQFWLLCGAVVGAHLTAWHRAVLRYRPLVLAGLPLAAGILTVVYLRELTTIGVGGASAPMQPVILLWACAALAASYVAAVGLAGLRVSWLQLLFRRVGHLSFGIYLAHPFVLDLVMVVLRRLGLVRPDAGTVLLALALTCVLTVSFCLLVLRTPVAGPLIGRSRPRVPAGTKASTANPPAVENSGRHVAGVGALQT